MEMENACFVKEAFYLRKISRNVSRKLKIVSIWIIWIIRDVRSVFFQLSFIFKKNAFREKSFLLVLYSAKLKINDYFALINIY